jgi:tight adherence protein B
VCFCLAGVAAAAGGHFTVRHVGVGGYPVVDLVVRGTGSTLPPIYENGQRVSDTSAQNLSSQKAIVLAVDRSQSMAGTPLTRASDAAASFVQSKPGSDLVSVVTFGSTAVTQGALSQSTINADSALRTLSPDAVQGTALYDAVVVASSQLAGQTYPGRVLVLLTDGRDVGSLATLAEAVRAARRDGVVVYAIALGNAYAPPLQHLTRATGGILFTGAKPGSLKAIYRRIGTELGHTWRVTYATSARPGDTISVSVGSPHALGVSARVPGRPAAPVGTFLPSVLVRGGLGLMLLIAAVSLVFFLAVVQARRLPQSARIKQLVRTHTDPPGTRRTRSRRAALAALVASLDRPLRGMRQWKRIEALIEAAGVRISAATVIAAGLLLGVLFAVIVTLAGFSGVIAFLAFLLGVVTPLLVIRTVAHRRVQAFERTLPDVLTTVAGSLKVGQGLKSALQTVAQEGAPPVSDELRRVLAEERLGRPLEDALVSMCERLGSDDLLYVATAVDVHSQVGGSVAGVFATVAETVRQRQQHRRRVRALSSLGRTTAKVLAFMPLGFIIILSLVNPSYIGPFVRSNLGHLLLAYSAVSVTIGFFIINRLVNVEY